MHTLLLIDTSSYIHRTYHGYKHFDPLKNIDGKPFWVPYGVIKKFQELINYYKPDYVISCEDTRDNAFLRRKIYPLYKDDRIGKGSNDELSIQFADAAYAISCMGITQLAINGYEADDVIAALVRKFKSSGLRIIIVTGDKDLSQLVDSKTDVEVHLNNGKGNGPLKYEELMTEDDVVQKYGVDPIRIPDLFGLIGDKTDGIPGVPGMHKTIAPMLLSGNRFSSLEDLYSRLNDIRDEYPGMSASQLRTLLENNREIAFISKLLASPLPVELNVTLGTAIVDPDPIPLMTFMETNGLEKRNSSLGIHATLPEMRRYMAIIRLLIACNNDYYTKGKSMLTDKQYDELLEEAKDMESNIKYKFPGSPTQHVGSDKTNFGTTIKHDVPMISLDNSYDPEDLHKWMNNIQSEYDIGVDFSVEWKWDGISLALKYVNGILDRAITRGDGIEGGDVTINAKELIGVPYRLTGKYSDFTNEIRGEVMISKSDFLEVNAERVKKGLPEFANPRNASSVIRSGNNPQDIKDRRMQFRAYKLVHSKTSSAEDTELMKELGFNVSEHIETITAIRDKVIYIITKYDMLRKVFPYPTDGLVISVTNKVIRDELGETNKFPRWAKAYKFNPEGGLTSLLDVRWQVGRKGTITPVAIIEPVEVSGSVISKASIHNIDKLQEKNMKLGDIILVEKAAEIIPQIIKVVNTHEDNTPIKIPEVCPCCGGRLERDGVALCCINDACPDRVKAYLEYIASKDILDLKDFGPSVVDMLYKRGVRDILGLFDEKSYSGLEFEEGYGETSKANLLESIDNIKKNGLDLYRLIASLGIPLVGKTIGKKISAVSDIDSFINGLSHLNVQIGDKAKQYILNYLIKPENIIRIRKLLEIVPIKNTMNVMRTNKLLGKSFCISGTLPTTKDKIEKLIRENGGVMLSGVSANLSYLIAEDLSNKKPQKAQKIGVPVITYKEFMNLLK
jgi:DNA ligase (NAD+)